MDNKRQQIVESIKANSNILVTVSTDPSVDELSAALGLTMLLNKMDKRATAVVSGTIPPAINFLEPEKTFENSADSLRDFIIALDKEKADHLRYKVDGDVVKIFITPYKTTLTRDDLDFSQGDYNVELVIAIGVKDQEHLDKALSAHGKILHDATVVTVTTGSDASKLGAVDWHDGSASSLSELITSLADGLKDGSPLLDEQISSALLTGIVSATARFSNDRTTSRVMTMAAQLMAAGANQQLIAAKLEEAHDIAPGVQSANTATDDSSGAIEMKDSGTELVIERGSKKDDTEIQPTPDEVIKEERTEETVQKELETQLAGLTTAPATTMADIEESLQQEAEAVTAENDADVVPLTAVSDSTMPGFEASEAPVPQPSALEPHLDPTFDATPPLEQPQQQPDTPPVIINEHGTFSDQAPEQSQPLNSIQSDPNEGEQSVDPFSTPTPSSTIDPQSIVPPLDTPTSEQSMSIGTAEGAALLGAEPLSTETSPAPVAPPDSMPTLPPLPPLPPLPTDGSLPPLPPPPPLPDFGQSAGPAVQPLSGAVSGDVFGDTVRAPEAPAPAPSAPEPGQFRIPGQG